MKALECDGKDTEVNQKKQKKKKVHFRRGKIDHAERLR